MDLPTSSMHAASCSFYHLKLHQHPLPDTNDRGLHHAQVADLVDCRHFLSRRNQGDMVGQNPSTHTEYLLKHELSNGIVSLTPRLRNEA